jgi:hypothetical protein
VKSEATLSDEQVQLPPRGWLRLHGDGAPSFCSQAPLPHSTDVSGGGIGEEFPEQLGFGVGGRGGPLYRRW